MLSSLYREEIFAKTQESFALNESNMSKGFSVFHDYLGLANLVVQRNNMKPQQQLTHSYYQHPLPHQPQMTMEQLPSPTGSSASSIESMDFISPMFESTVSRKRMNSLESDARSESSNSSRTTESDMYIDVNDLSPVLSSVPFFPPPLQNAAMMMGESLQSIEPILANLKTPVGSRLSQVMHQQKQSGKNNSVANKVSVCVFCRNNGESREFYSSHTLKDNEGCTTCPILRAYTCPLCKANGDQSHTIKYCPKYTPKAASPPITTPGCSTRIGLF